MAAPANTPQKNLHGINGICTIQAYALDGTLGTETLFDFTMTDFSHDPGLEPVTNSGDGGWARKIPGIQEITGTLNFIYDVANRPFINPYKLYPGNMIKLKFVLNAIASPGLSISDADSSQLWAGVAIIGAWGPKTGPQAGAIAISMPFSSQGQWVVPTA